MKDSVLLFLISRDQLHFQIYCQHRPGRLRFRKSHKFSWRIIPEMKTASRKPQGRGDSQLCLHKPQHRVTPKNVALSTPTQEDSSESLVLVGPKNSSLSCVPRNAFVFQEHAGG